MFFNKTQLSVSTLEVSAPHYRILCQIQIQRRYPPSRASWHTPRNRLQPTVMVLQAKSSQFTYSILLAELNSHGWQCWRILMAPLISVMDFCTSVRFSLIISLMPMERRQPKCVFLTSLLTGRALVVPLFPPLLAAQLTLSNHLHRKPGCYPCC